ncbi:hypothetical protein EV426DRAFT_711820 [Tirmania nivea]|nr:hypothetical protein EV426DRAFT_711820 [Tirmania nivea]
MAGSSEASQSDSGARKGEAMPSAIIPTRSISPPQTTQEIQSVTRRVRTLAERTLDRNLDRAEIKEKFIDLMANEDYGIGRMIREAGESVGVLANAQVQIIEQATDRRIYKSAVVKRQNNNITTETYWGPSWIKNFGEVYPPWPSVEFTRMCAQVSAVLSFDKGLDLLTDILPRLRAEIQARIDTPRTNKERWVMVEDLKWVLEQDNLPPNLSLDE